MRSEIYMKEWFISKIISIIWNLYYTLNDLTANKIKEYLFSQIQQQLLILIFRLQKQNILNRRKLLLPLIYSGSVIENPLIYEINHPGAKKYKIGKSPGVTCSMNTWSLLKKEWHNFPVFFTRHNTLDNMVFLREIFKYF